MKSIDWKALLIGGAAGLILGLLLGMLLFWQLFPVKWTDAQTYDLAPEARADYVTLLANLYKADKDRNRAAKALELWHDDEKQQAFSDAIQAAEAAGQGSQVQAIRDLAMVLAVPEQPSAPSAQPPRPPGLIERLRVPCLVFAIVLLVLVLGALALRTMSRRRAAAPEPKPRGGFAQVPPRTEEQQEPQGSPLGPWIASYTLGEDAYDESFRIETPSGNYLGECGMGILDVVGSGKPDQVTALEVWLFDKNDIRTVTKVVMSERAFQDDAARAKLASKGEPVLAEVGVPFVLKTRGLQVQANITELEYGQGDEGPNSFFSKLTVQLTAMPRSADSAGNPS